jgi:hypothetical protein
VVLAAGLAGAQHVEADPADRGGQPGPQVADRSGVAAVQPQPALLDRVLGLARRAEHAVGNRLQVRAPLLELHGDHAALVHLASSPGPC